MVSKQVTLDGQTLHGRDRYGSWRVHSMEGWVESPPAKEQIVSPSNRHGDYKMPVHYGPRTVTLSGRLSAGSPELASQAKLMLTALVQEQCEFVVTSGEGLTISAPAQRGRITPGNISGRWLPFSIELRLPDPFKYGERRTVQVASGASETVFHRGTVDAWPRAYVSGSMPDGYTLTLGGQQVSVPMGIPSGATHMIDYRRRRLYVNGSLFMGAFGTSNFRPVPRGRRATAGLSAPAGSGKATFTVYDTYV